MYIYDIYLSYTVSLPLIQFLVRLLARIRRFLSFSFLSPFFSRRREKCIYIHKSFTFTPVTLNCICFTSVDERVSSRSQSSGFLARYAYLLFPDARIL